MYSSISRFEIESLTNSFELFRNMMNYRAHFETIEEKKRKITSWLRFFSWSKLNYDRQFQGRSFGVPFVASFSYTTRTYVRNITTHQSIAEKRSGKNRKRRNTFFSAELGIKN